MNLHETEEHEFADGPRLWDATPGVCCAAFQLGACAHTEAPGPWDEDDADTFETIADFAFAVEVAGAADLGQLF